MHSILETARRDQPGEYLPEEALQKLEAEVPYLAPRIRAARIAREKERQILEVVVEPMLRKYGFEEKIPLSKGKCYRDVASVYRHCVFAMLCDSVSLLEDKLLWWLRTILQSQAFPGRSESIQSTYSLLRKEVSRKLPAEDAALLDPCFAACERILPMEEAPKA
jgi:hypothetical protein